MKKIISLPEFIMIALTILFCIYGTGFAERITVNGGGGWDGSGYVYYARELPRLLEEKEVDTYYLARFFPSVAVRGIMEVYSFVSGTAIKDISKAHVINMFAIWAALCLIGSVVLMLNLFKEQQTCVRWWVWGLFLCNFYILKMTFFYPTLTDTTACFLACLMLWGYKKNVAVVFWLACVLGYFTHPLLFYSGVVLWIFKKEEFKNVTVVPSVRWNVIITAVVLTGLLVKFILVIQNRPFHVREATALLLPLSIVLALVYIAYVVYFSNPYAKIQLMLKAVLVKRLVLTLLAWALLALLLRFFATATPGLNYREFLHYMIYDAISDPLIFLVSHVVYFGLGVLLLILFFSDVRKKLAQEGLGLQLVFWGSLLFAINSESRQLVIFWPMMVYLLADIVAEKLTNNKFLCISGVFLALAWSRFWLILQPSSYEGELEIYTFPQQLYFMHQGPWMTHQMYLIHLLLILLITGLLYLLWKFLPSTVQRNQDSSY